MYFKCIPDGLYDSNMYIVAKNKEGVIIDAGVKYSEISKILEDDNIKIRYIILTHGHYDHIGYLHDLYEKTGAKVLIHENDEGAFWDSNISFSQLFGLNYSFDGERNTIKGGEILNVGGMNIEALSYAWTF